MNGLRRERRKKNVYKEKDGQRKEPQSNNRNSNMLLTCLIEEQIYCHRLNELSEETQPRSPPNKLKQPFPLSIPNPIRNIPKPNNSTASYIVKINFASE